MPGTTATSQTLHLDSPVDRGPVLRRYRRRALWIWLALALTGLLPQLLDLSPQWRAAGLGLWMPGGGFLYTASPHYLVLTLVLFAVSLVLWLLVGGFIFPLLVWGSSAALATLDTGETLWLWAQAGTPLLALSIIGYALLRQNQQAKAAAPGAAAIKAHLETIPLRTPSKTAPVGDELSDQELGALRYTLDLALQPIEKFDGFVTIDQFREAAWRYQLVSISYALAILQTSRVPAFRGYLHEAQRRTIVKMQDRRVWKYWRVENFLGNLRFDADPIKRDNIMYSGWWALALGAYERATGDLQFSKPGALTLRESDSRQFVYDYPKIVEVLARNFDADKLALFPCEPNWVFSICNLFGMTGMQVFDRVHNTRFSHDRLELFNKRMEEEFTTADGRAALIAARRTGFIISTDKSIGFSGNVQLLNMTSPRQAQVYWALCLRSLEQQFGDPSKWDAENGIDAGNYKKNGVSFWVQLMRSAREMGDTDIYEFARQRYDDMGIENRDGALHWQGSVLMQATSHMARFGTEGAWYRMANGEVPAAITSGPVLDDAPYPHVLVAGANNDGAKLDLVLCAGTEPGSRPLRFARLLPNHSYQLSNSEPGHVDTLVNADAKGELIVTTTVGKRSRISLSPTS